MSTRPPAASAQRIARSAASLLLRSLDTLNGQRPLYALRHRSTPAAYRDLTHLVDQLAFKKARISSIAARHMGPDRVEANALVTVAGRVHAITVSLEQRNHWRLEHIHVLGMSRRVTEIYRNTA